MYGNEDTVYTEKPAIPTRSSGPGSIEQKIEFVSLAG